MTDQLESKMINLCVAYRDVGEGREQEQGRGSVADRDVGNEREQGRGSVADGDVGAGAAIAETVFDRSTPNGSAT